MRKHIAVLSAAILACILAGCGEEARLKFVYQRKALVQIPPEIKKVAVAQFQGEGPDDKFADMVSDDLIAKLDEQNRTFHRYELVDRKHLKGVMDERDLQMAISDSSAANKMGKLANVNAMIYGTVKFDSRQSTGYRQVFDFATKSTKSVPYPKLYCLLTVSFSMNDINTGSALTTRVIKLDYDSEKENNKSAAHAIAAAMGAGGDKVDAADQVKSRLAEQAVQAFVETISPYNKPYDEKLESVRTEAAKRGNRLAAANSFPEALECYEEGLKANPKDDGACFNAGLVCEVTGELPKAQSYYKKAMLLSGNKRYTDAFSRVKKEQANQGSEQN